MPLVLLLFDEDATVFPVDFFAVEDGLFGTGFFEDVTFLAEVLLGCVVAAIPPITQRTDRMAAGFKKNLNNLTCIQRTTTSVGRQGFATLLIVFRTWDTIL